MTRQFRRVCSVYHDSYIRAKTGHCLVTLLLTINETLQRLARTAAHLNARVILVVTV